MKHTIQTLKKNLTLAEVEALEKELKEWIEKVEKLELDTNTGKISRFWVKRTLKEILGDE